MVRMPPGLPVAVCRIGKSGRRNAAIGAGQILAMSDRDLNLKLKRYLKANVKPVQLGVVSSEKEKSDGNFA